MDASVLIPVYIHLTSVGHILDLLSQGYCIKTPANIYLKAVDGGIYDYETSNPIFHKLYSIYTDRDTCIELLSVDASPQYCTVLSIGYKHIIGMDVVANLSNDQLIDLINDLTKTCIVRVDNWGYVDANNFGLIRADGYPIDDRVLITLKAEFEYREKNAMAKINLYLLNFTNNEVAQLKHYLVSDGKLPVGTKIHTKCLYYNLVTDEGYPISEYLVPMLITYIVNGGSVITSNIWGRDPVTVDYTHFMPTVYVEPVTEDTRLAVLDDAVVSKRFTLEPITLTTYNEMLDAFEAGYVIRTLDNGFYVKERNSVYCITSKDICSGDTPISFNSFDTIFSATIDFRTLTVYTKAWGILNIERYQMKADQYKIVNIVDFNKRQTLCELMTFNGPPNEEIIANQVNLVATYIATLCTPAGRNDADYTCNRVIITEMVPLFMVVPLVAALTTFNIKAVYIGSLIDMSKGWPHIVPVNIA